MIKNNRYWLYVAMAALSFSAASTFTYSSKAQADIGSQTPIIKSYQTGSTATSSGDWGGCPWKAVGDTLTIGETGKKYNITTGTGGKNPFSTDHGDTSIAHVKIQGSITLPSDSSGLLGYMFNVVDIEGLDNLHTQNVTNMSSMFSNDGALTSLDVSNFDTSNVTDMEYMFDEDSALTSLDVSEFDTSSVTNMDEMFFHDYGLTSLDLSSFDTSSVTNMEAMFVADTSLISLNLSNFDTSNVTDMYRMFAGDSSLTSLNVSSFNTPNLLHMDYMFAGDTSLTSLDLSNFDMSHMNFASGLYCVLDESNSMLWKLTLGRMCSNEVLDYLPDHEGKQIPGSNPGRTAGPGWQAVGTGTADDPQGTLYATNRDFNFNRPAETETYVWQQKSTSISAAPITINYLDNDGNLLATKTISATDKHVGDTYDTSKAPYTDSFITTDGKKYDVLTNPLPANAKGEFTKDSQTVTYHCKQADAGNITIHYYKKGTTDQVQADKVLPGAGKWGDSASDAISSSQEQTISPYYQYDSTNGSTDLTFGDRPQSVIFYYTIPSAKTVTVEYLEKNGKSIRDSQVIGNKDSKVGDPYDATTSAYKLPTITVKDGTVYTLNKDKLPDPAIAAGHLTQNAIIVKYYYNTTDAAPVNIKYVDENGQSIHNDKVLSGVVGKKYDATPYKLPSISFNGNTYTLDAGKVPADSVLKNRFTADKKTITFTYQKKSTPVTPVDPVNPVNPVNPINPAPTPQPTPKPETATNSEPATAAAKGSAVYALNKMYLYKSANFNKHNRIAKYVQKPRVYRPMFVVTGYARSTNGALRYKVRDVNHLSKTAGKRGYVTAKWKYVRPVYYQSKHQTLTVINPRGVNAYKKANLTGKVKNYKQGTVLHVTRFVHHNLTTRYVLSNGHYITGNRKLVNMGKHKQVRYVKVKKAITRYQTVNLTGHKKQIKKGTKLRVKNYDYSHAHNVNQSGALRYRVAGGYITGNAKYVKVIK